MKTGIIQQANTGNIQENRLSLKQKIENLADKEPSSLFYKSFTTHCISARQKTPAISTLQLQFPEKQPHSIAK